MKQLWAQHSEIIVCLDCKQNSLHHDCCAPKPKGQPEANPIPSKEDLSKKATGARKVLYHITGTAQDGGTSKAMPWLGHQSDPKEEMVFLWHVIGTKGGKRVGESVLIS
jgi:hypothetical protein